MSRRMSSPIAAGVALSLCLATVPAAAQTPTELAPAAAEPDPGKRVELRKGTRAPYKGLLLDGYALKGINAKITACRSERDAFEKSTKAWQDKHKACLEEKATELEKLIGAGDRLTAAQTEMIAAQERLIASNETLSDRVEAFPSTGTLVTVGVIIGVVAFAGGFGVGYALK